jgi:alkanesulfonate monooxygenase SsuD/methylene tetrahydromethanopterin reductase-like flavin-dependent oxidoreductase (luciferase family)
MRHLRGLEPEDPMDRSPELRVGTVASPSLLRSPHALRQEFVEAVIARDVDHVFVADHVSFRNGSGSDALINAATLTASHPALTVCVGVYLLALRNPVTVARQLATLAESAPGRLIFGVGVGGEDRNEIAMCGVDPRTRGRRTDECLEVLRGLAAGEPFDFDGEFFRFSGAHIVPAPDPPIPILVGGRSDAAVLRAARFADGWLAAWCSPQRFADAVALFRDHPNRRGAPEGLHGLQLWVGIDDDPARARARLAAGMEEFYQTPFRAFEKYSPSGTPADVAEFLRPYRDAGCRLFNVMPMAESEAEGVAAVAEVKRLLA